MLRKLRQIYIDAIVNTRVRFSQYKHWAAEMDRTRAIYIANPTKANKAIYKHAKRMKYMRLRSFRRARTDRTEKRNKYNVNKYKSDRQRAVDYAVSILGAKEVPAYSNRGPQVTPWQKSFGSWLIGQPWCGVFVGVILRHVGVRVNSRIAAVAFIEDDARAGRNGFKSWKSARRGSEGDVAVLFGRGIHTGFILSHDRKLGGYWVAEGNTSPNNTGSQSNGGGSYRRFRSYSQVRGIAVPRYKDE